MKNSDEFIQKVLDKNHHLVAKSLNNPQLYEYLNKRIKELPGQGTKIITLVGGVASGKTTLAKKLVKKLKDADSITTDSFSAGTREYRHSQYGNVEKKYDLELYKKKINSFKDLNPGEEIRFPHYDQATGIAAAAGEENFPKKVKKVKYFIIEGDFNFSKGEEDLSIYFHVPDEVRTKNRIKRDTKKRSAHDMKELLEDIKVREEKQHFPFTLPNAENADILVTVRESGGKYGYSVYERN